jgi:hypothetical protein
MLVATSMVMWALVQHCNYNIIRVLQATMYKSVNISMLRVVDCGLGSYSIIGASVVQFSVLQIGRCTLQSWVRCGRLSQTVVVSCGVLSWSAEQHVDCEGAKGWLYAEVLFSVLTRVVNQT